MIEFSQFSLGESGPYSLSLERGAILGLVGWRGAAATQLLEAKAGVRRHRGEVRVAGHARKAADVAYAPEEVEQILFGRTASEAIGPLGQAFAARLGADGLLGRPPQELSSGERRRLALAAVLGSGRPLLLLDRPTAGLDPEGQELFWQAAEACTGALVMTLSHQAEAAACTALLPVPGQGGPWPGGPMSAERQRLLRWPPDEASGLAWTLGIRDGTRDLAEEVERWRARRRRR